MANDTLQKSSENKKEFHYAKNDVKLDFTLGIDNSSQLRNFLACISAAKEDLEELIKTFKN